MRIVVLLLLLLFAVAFLLALVLAVGTMNERGLRKLVMLVVTLVVIHLARDRFTRR